MVPTIDINKRLADYIYKDLTPEEMYVIEREIQKDPDFFDAYQLNKKVTDYLKAKIQLEEMKSDPLLEEAEALADLAFEMDSAEEDLQPILPGGKRKRNRIRKITVAVAIAASVALLLTFGILPSQLDQGQLFDQYYSPLEASDYSQRGQSNVLYNDLALGINYYMDGDYQRSIEKFSELAPAPEVQSEVRFFTALSYLGLEQYQASQTILEFGLGADSRYQAEILWYLSLCYLKTGEPDKAKALLMKLELYDGLYKKDAQTLIRKLRRFK